MKELTTPVHLRLRGKVDEATERLAVRAALTAAHLLGLAVGTHLRSLRATRDPLAEAQARLQEANLRARLAWEIIEILIARFAKVPENSRPYYTPAQRFRITEIKNVLGWCARQTARVFLVCPNTVLNWERHADPTSKMSGSTVKPTPPLRRAADVVRSTVQLMTRLGFGGPDMIARILARAGWKVSPRSVARYRKERTITPAPDTTPATTPTHPVIARFVHHTWMMDVSIVKQLLGPDLYIASVFDAFSRVPLTLEVFERKPLASQMARLLRLTARAFAKPRYVITDLGKEFDAKVFSKAVARLGAKQRFASKDNIKATARLERFWRSLKENACLYRLQLPLTAEDLEQRLALTLTHYLCFRPHEGLGGATPAEVFLGITPAHHNAVEPPRGPQGDRSTHTPFHIEHLDPKNSRFPILKPAA